MKTKQLFLLFFVLIISIAALFRLYKLDSIPPGLYPDVAINGNDALDTLNAKSFKVFYPENNGREGLIIWLSAFSFLIFGVSIWAIKIVAVFFGILTVIGLYLLSKELFRLIFNPPSSIANEIVALLSSFFLAVSFWHTLFSRIGFRVILFPFVLVYSFYFLFKALRTEKTLFFVLSGIVFGLGFYTYIGFRLAALLLFIVLPLYYFLNRKDTAPKKHLFSLLILLFSIFVTALPIGLYFLSHPADFIGRAGQVSIFSQNNPFQAFVASLIAHLGMFNIAGDMNWRHNLSGYPMLSFPVGILFIVGIIFSIKELIISIKDKDGKRLFAHSFLFLWFFITLLPAFLTYEGIPHALRAFGVVPAVYLFVGLGGWKLFDLFNKNTQNKRLLYLATILLLIAIPMAEFKKYFVYWGENLMLNGAFSTDFVDIGKYLNLLPASVQKYVIVNQGGVPVPWPNGVPMPAQTIIFLERAKYGEIRSVYLTPEQIYQIKTDNKPTIIVLMIYDEEILYKLSILFPEGHIQKESGISLFKINFN